MTKDTLADQLNALVPGRQPGMNTPSETRNFLRAHFDTITAARTRGRAVLTQRSQRAPHGAASDDAQNCTGRCGTG
jgi:hypothetical protein